MVRRRQTRAQPEASIISIPAGGCLNPLWSAELAQVVDCAHGILERVGMAGLPDHVVESLQTRGAKT